MARITWGLLGEVAGVSGGTTILSRPRGVMRSRHQYRDQTWARWRRRECPKAALRYCDALYTQMGPADRLPWRRAARAPHLSGYRLWMKECMACVAAGERPPDAPSPSGGYSSRLVTPGEEHPGLPVCGWDDAPPWSPHCGDPGSPCAMVAAIDCKLTSAPPRLGWTGTLGTLHWAGWYMWDGYWTHDVDDVAVGWYCMDDVWQLAIQVYDQSEAETWLWYGDNPGALCIDEAWRGDGVAVGDPSNPTSDPITWQLLRATT